MRSSRPARTNSLAALGIRRTGPLGIVATLMGPLTRRCVDTEIAGPAAEASRS